MMVKLKVKNLEFYIQGKKILNDISLDIPKGSFVGIIGPNGSGKSTLLKNIYRVYKPSKGEIIINNNSLSSLSSKECAKQISVLAQESGTNFDFTVKQIVEMGRYPHKKMLENYNATDKTIVECMINKLGLSSYSDRLFNSLSGGEKQRTLIARALTQESDFMILDEPTNHLDIGYQIQIMDIVKKLDITVLSAIHDMNIAAMYCDYLIVMKEGKILDFGPAKKILTSDMIKDVFGVSSYIETNPLTQKPAIYYISSNI